MKQTLRKIALSATIMISAFGLKAQTMFGLTNNNEIFTMTNANSPSAISGPYTVSGVTSGQMLVGLDARSSNGMLYALGYDTAGHSGTLYTISGSGSTYTATKVNTIPTTMFLGTAASVGFDFVSTLSDRIRIIGNNGVNYAMNADNGALVNTGSSNIAFNTNDSNAFTIAAIGATAYTNAYYGADAADEIGYDMTNNVLVRFAGANYYYYNNNANYPTQVSTIGASGLVLAADAGVGMDAWYDTATHTSTIWLSATPLLATGAHLYKMNSTTGLAQDMGLIGSGSLYVRDIAWQISRDTVAPAMQGEMVTALTLNMRNLIFFDSRNPSYIRRMVRVNSVTGGQALIAIAYNMNHTLYGLGYNPTNKTYQIYTIDTLSGMAHSVSGATTGNIDLGDDHSLYSNSSNINVGFNFIGNTNIIRVIGKNGLTNVQIDAVTGAILHTDNAVMYGTGDANFGQTVNIGSIAWLNNYDTNDSDHTTMYAYDFNTGAMVNLNSSVSGNSTISTLQSLNSVLNIFGTGAYRNAYMDISYKAADNTSNGYIISNYYGDSAATENYSSFYTMNNMTASTNPAIGPAERIGGGTPAKSVAVGKSSRNTAVYNVTAAGKTDLVAYPNPTQADTRILLSSPANAKVVASVMDMAGRIIGTYEFPAGTTALTISMSNMPTGLYNVRVAQQGSPDQMLKIIKD